MCAGKLSDARCFAFGKRGAECGEACKMVTMVVVKRKETGEVAVWDAMNHRGLGEMTTMSKTMTFCRAAAGDGPPDRIFASVMGCAKIGSQSIPTMPYSRSRDGCSHWPIINAPFAVR